MDRILEQKLINQWRNENPGIDNKNFVPWEKWLEKHERTKEKNSD